MAERSEDIKYSDGLVTVEMNLNRIYSHTWLEPTKDGYKGMAHTIETTLHGEEVRNEIKPTGLICVWETVPKPTILQRIQGFFSH